MSITSESLAARDVSAHSACQASLPQEEKVHGSSLGVDQTVTLSTYSAVQDQLHCSQAV